MKDKLNTFFSEHYVYRIPSILVYAFLEPELDVQHDQHVAVVDSYCPNLVHNSLFECFKGSGWICFKSFFLRCRDKKKSQLVKCGQ